MALVGAPNSGKTTLYNWLTSSHYRVVNYPGSTVEYAVGKAAPRLQFDFAVIDTPGTYSLFPKSLDEEVTLKALYMSHSVGRVTHLAVVVDGTQLDRHLLLAKQAKAIGLPMMVIVTMADLIRRSSVKFRVDVLAQALDCPVVLFDGRMGQGLQQIAQTLRQISEPPAGPDTRGGIKAHAGEALKLQPWSDDQLLLEQSSVDSLAREVWHHEIKGLQEIYHATASADRILLHPVYGMLVFFLLMSLLFTSIYWLAKPMMEGVDLVFTGASEWVLHQQPDSVLFQFLGEGLLKGFGSVMVFVPQIFILFFGIGLLEGSGYLARAATLIDRPFAKLGLSGRSFVPLLSGFACAVPAMMASRNLSSRRDRWITNFIIPLMTCSARLPVYSLLLGFLFFNEPAWKAGVALAGLYLASAVLGALAAGVLNLLLPRREVSFFMMELPLYRRPRLTVLFRQSLHRTRAYILRAGPMIFFFALLIWGGTHFPTGAGTRAEGLEKSYLGQMGHYLTPVVKPMGVDWRVGIGMISAFAAREVFVSTLAIIFQVTGGEASRSEGLLKAMGEARWPDGSPLFTGASVMALIVFFMVALQCMSTFAVASKENSSLAFAITQLVVLNLVAYGLAVGVFQIFSMAALS
ncbi:MAG: ferrous iron transport protein B [Bdellovibrio sp.]|nr:MAG: ferrous iron transport protein B [Bdellovibrio sp.]